MGVQVPELKQCVAFVYSSRVLVSRRECLLLLLLLLLLQSDCAFFREMRNFCAVERTRRLLPPFRKTKRTDSCPLLSRQHARGRYMDKKLKLKLNGNRGVIGILRGFDQFLNLVLDECVNDSTAEKTPLGMVVVRGASVLSMEALEHIAPVQRKSTM